MKKGKSMYVNYQKKGETGKEYTQDDADIDIEAAERAWLTFFALKKARASGRNVGKVFNPVLKLVLENYPFSLDHCFCNGRPSLPTDP